MRGERSPIAVFLAATWAGSAACVLPSHGASGFELSWGFREGNGADDTDDALIRRERTCAGAGVETVTVDVTDEDEPERQGHFEFECGRGQQSDAEFNVFASSAFIDLRGGEYMLSVLAFGPDGALVGGSDTEKVEALTPIRWTFTPPVVGWTLDLSGAASCTQAALTLRYADPPTTLADFDVEEPEHPPYRANLASDRGLGLGGQPAQCHAGLDGAHVFAEMDPGTYLLDVTRDGVTCTFTVDVTRGGPHFALDLENLTCPQ